MLVYHEHHDTYHCILRLLSIVTIVDKESIELSKLRIIDFFFVFPHLVNDISFPRLKGASKIKSQSKSFPEPYEILPNKKRLFSEMGDFQIQAIHVLKAKEILRDDEFGNISVGSEFANNKVLSLLAGSRYLSSEYFRQLTNILYSIPLLGEKGIKKRTGLMEYRYDPI